MGPYDPRRVIKTEVVAALPERFTKAGSRPGKVSSCYARPQVGVDCYLEGPSFDRDGHLYFTDVPHGRIFRMAPSGEIDLVAEYDGEPNGLKIHKDGRIFIADYRHGVMVLDPASGSVASFADLLPAESFKGLNDLVFASNGDLYFTDQGVAVIRRHQKRGAIPQLAKGRYVAKHQRAARLASFERLEPGGS